MHVQPARALLCNRLPTLLRQYSAPDRFPGRNTLAGTERPRICDTGYLCSKRRSVTIDPYSQETLLPGRDDDAARHVPGAFERPERSHFPAPAARIAVGLPARTVDIIRKAGEAERPCSRYVCMHATLVLPSSARALSPSDSYVHW